MPAISFLTAKMVKKLNHLQKVIVSNVVILTEAYDILDEDDRIRVTYKPKFFTVYNSRIPQQVQKRADIVLQRSDRVILKTNKHEYRTLRIGNEYRLLNKGKSWVLMSHQQYNREIDK